METRNLVSPGFVIPIGAAASVAERRDLLSPGLARSLNDAGKIFRQSEVKGRNPELRIAGEGLYAMAWASDAVAKRE